MGAVVPLLLMFAVFYFILIRPQVKRQKEHQALLTKLQKGDIVITRGGIVGKIFRSTDREIILEIEDKMKVKVLRSFIEGKYNPASQDGISLVDSDDTTSSGDKKAA